MASGGCARKRSSSRRPGSGCAPARSGMIMATTEAIRSVNGMSITVITKRKIVLTAASENGFMVLDMISSGCRAFTV